MYIFQDFPEALRKWRTTGLFAENRTLDLLNINQHCQTRKRDVQSRCGYKMSPCKNTEWISTIQELSQPQHFETIQIFAKEKSFTFQTSITTENTKTLYQWFSTFVRPRPGNFFFYKFVCSTPQKHNATRLETTTKQRLLPLTRRCHGHEPADQVLTNIFNRLLDIL
jgi:hypothetical protein